MDWKSKLQEKKNINLKNNKGEHIYNLKYALKRHKKQTVNKQIDKLYYIK